jgi:hypothetical protein
MPEEAGPRQRRRATGGGFWLLLVCAVLPGAAGVLVFGYFALVDWAALQDAYAHYRQVAASDAADLRAVFVAEAQQNIHRVNLFADGVWTLLSAILAAIGLHGLHTRACVEAR